MVTNVDGEIRGLISKVEELVGKAEKTDYIMPVILPFIPTIVQIIGGVLFMGGVFTTSGLTTGRIYSAFLITMGIVVILVGIVMNFWVIYRWIKRRNEHFERSLLYYETLVELAEKLDFKRGVILKSRLNELREINRKMRSALANTILTILPFYIYYVYHFLNKDFAKHSEREKLFLAELFDELRERFPSFTRRIDEVVSVPERSTLLYLILTWVTGLFLIYWVYTLTKDPNKHFESHYVIERDVLVALKEMAKG